MVDEFGGDGWAPDTLCVVYSTTKGVAALVVAMLVGRGALDYDAPIATWWPEFAANGKEHITLAQLLSHQSGLAGLDESLTLADVADREVLAARLAAQAPMWEPGTAHGYHAMTFGFYVGELVRRVDGRTIGQFVREELGGDIHIGLPAELRPRLIHLIATPPGAGMTDLDRPIVKAYMDPSSVTFKSMMLVPELAGDMTAPEVTGLEMASANGVADARSLAAAYDAAISGGLCPPEVLARATATAVDGEDVVLFERTAFGLGFMKPATGFFRVSRSESAFGHPGNGGSYAFADPHAHVSVAYVTNTLLSAADDQRMAAIRDSLEQVL